MRCSYRRIISTLTTSAAAVTLCLTATVTHTVDSSLPRSTFGGKSLESTAEEGLANIDAASAASTTVAAASRAGTSWPSGAYVPGSSPARYARFAAWRGSSLDVAVLWSGRQSWSDIVDPAWLYDAWSGRPGVKVIGVAPIPEGVPSATLARCAAGAYDSRWKAFARNIKAHGMDDETVVRLGWEFNGDWYRWSAEKPATFAKCWRRIVGTAEKVAPKLRWDWTVNRGPGQSVKDARKAYPGDAYVDIVGVDSYDVYPGVRDAADWRAHLHGAYGLQFWLDFARAHGKKLSVPEWGAYPGTAHAGHNGGDNPYYVAKMDQFFRKNATSLAYEAYFNESESYYAGSLFAPTQVPRAARQYLRDRR